MIRATEIFVVLAENEAGTPAHIGLPGLNQRSEEGIGAIGVQGLGLISLVKLYSEGPHNLDSTLKLGRQLARKSGKRLEVVRFTERHHHLWIDP